MIYLIKRYQSLQVSAKAALWFLMCTLVQNAFQFITVPIFTRLMPVEQYGIYNLYQAWSGILVVFCTMNVETGAFVNGWTNTKNIEGKNLLPVYLLSITTLLTFSIFVLFSLAYPILKRFIELPYNVVLLMFAGILATAPLSIWNMLQRFTYKYKKLVLVTLVIVSIQMFGGIYFVSLVPENEKAFQRILWLVLPSAIAGYIIYGSFACKAKKVFALKAWKETFKLQIPIVISNLSMVLLLSSNRIIINMYDSAKEVAIFSVAYSIGQIISVIKQSIVNAFHPWIYNKLEQKQFVDIEKLLYTLMLLLEGIALFASCLAPLVVRLFAPSSYYDAIYIVPFTSAAVSFTLISQVMVVIGTYYETTKIFIYASAASCVLNIVSNLLLIPILGYKIAGLTSLVSYMLLAYINYYFIVKNERFYNPFSAKTIFIFPIISSVCISAVSLLYSHLWALYILSFILLIICLVQRRNIVKIIGQRNL